MLLNRGELAINGGDFDVSQRHCSLLSQLGFIAFGGPAAHIAMMEEETVRRGALAVGEKFLDLLGAANMIPGPSSTELAIYIGYVQAGWLGLVLRESVSSFPLQSL